MITKAMGPLSVLVSFVLLGCERNEESVDPETGAATYDPLTAGTVTAKTRERVAQDRPPERGPKKARPKVEVKRSQPFDTDLIIYDGRVVRLKRDIEFAEDHLYIMEAGLEVIDDVIWMLESGTEITKMEIQVHAHPQMLEEERQVTQIRADLVKQYMEKKGIAGDRLVAHGYEATVPLDSNRTEAGRAANDRIEFVVLEVDGEPIVGGETPP